MTQTSMPTEHLPKQRIEKDRVIVSSQTPEQSKECFELYKRMLFAVDDYLHLRLDIPDAVIAQKRYKHWKTISQI